MALGTGTHRLNFLDYGAETHRPATRQDLERLVRLADALPGISVVAPMVEIADVPAEIVELAMLETLVLNTGKHIWNAPMTAQEARWTLDLAEMLGRETLMRQPTVTIRACAKSPLVLGDEVAQIIITSAQRGAILAVGSACAAGSTSPVTLAGTVLLQNAEFLFQMALAQLARPGTPIDYAVASTMTDLRTAMFNLGAVEYTLITAGSMTMAERYGLPLSTSHDTESPTIDVHDGLQKMLGIAYKMAMGVRFLRNAGSLNNGMTMSCEQLVIDHEIAQMIQRFWQGIGVDQDTLAADVICEVGPDGEFLTHEHTLKYCRSGEHYVSPLPLRRNHSDRPTLLKWAHEKAEEILSTYQYEPSTDKVEQVRRYVETERNEIRNAG
jgi:trimethylamine--corrinoid protein Co-methyltransferase